MSRLSQMSSTEISHIRGLAALAVERSLLVGHDHEEFHGVVIDAVSSTSEVVLVVRDSNTIIEHHHLKLMQS